jgi:hypothetical protein
MGLDRGPASSGAPMQRWTLSQNAKGRLGTVRRLGDTNRFRSLAARPCGRAMTDINRSCCSSGSLSFRTEAQHEPPIQKLMMSISLFLFKKS